MPSLLVEDNVGLATKHGSVSTITRLWEFRLREDHEEHSLQGERQSESHFEAA